MNSFVFMNNEEIKTTLSVFVAICMTRTNENGELKCILGVTEMSIRVERFLVVPGPSNQLPATHGSCIINESKEQSRVKVKGRFIQSDSFLCFKECYGCIGLNYWALFNWPIANDERQKTIWTQDEGLVMEDWALITAAIELLMIDSHKVSTRGLQQIEWEVTRSHCKLWWISEREIERIQGPIPWQIFLTFHLILIFILNWPSMLFWQKAK